MQAPNGLKAEEPSPIRPWAGRNGDLSSQSMNGEDRQAGRQAGRRLKHFACAAKKLSDIGRWIRERNIYKDSRERTLLVAAASKNRKKKERIIHAYIHTYIISGWLFLSQRFGASRVQLNGTCLFRYAAYLTGARGNHIGAATKMWLLVVKKKRTGADR